MKLSQICQWALVGLGAQYRALHFRRENCIEFENYEKADKLLKRLVETETAEQQVIDLIVKIKKGVIIDGTF